MQSHAANPTFTVLHLQGHVLNVLATMPGGLKDGSAIAAAVARLRPVVCDSPGLVAVVNAAEEFQARVDDFTAAETDRNYADLIDAFFAFRKMEKDLCPVTVH